MDGQSLTYRGNPRVGLVKGYISKHHGAHVHHIRLRSLKDGKALGNGVMADDEYAATIEIGEYEHHVSELKRMIMSLDTDPGMPFDAQWAQAREADRDYVCRVLDNIVAVLRKKDNGQRYFDGSFEDIARGWVDRVEEINPVVDLTPPLPFPMNNNNPAQTRLTAPHPKVDTRTMYAET